MAEKYFDFDAFMDERKGTDKPFIVKAFGEKHEIPNDVPFDVILEIQRSFKDGKTEMDEEQLVSMCQTIFGEDTFKKWLSKGIGLKGIIVLTEKVMESYMESSANTSRTMADKKKDDMPNP